MPVFVATIRVSRTRSSCSARLSANIAMVAATNRPSPAHHAARVYRSRRTARRVRRQVPAKSDRCEHAHHRHTASRTADRSSWSP